MSKHITGEFMCECGREIRWLLFHYADIMRGEEPEWIALDGRVEVDKNNQVKCECGKLHDVKIGAKN